VDPHKIAGGGSISTNSQYAVSGAIGQLAAKSRKMHFQGKIGGGATGLF
jgi:hypothetical protein